MKSDFLVRFRQICPEHQRILIRLDTRFWNNQRAAVPMHSLSAHSCELQPILHSFKMFGGWTLAIFGNHPLVVREDGRLP